VRIPILAVAAAVAGAGCAGETRQPVEIGQPAPRYVATTLAGDSAATAALAGKVVLLNIWATWCAPCRQEIPYLQSLYQKHAAEGLEIVGVSVDARGQDAEIREFVKDFGMTYPIWRDPDERIQSLYLALGVPASYLIDRAGVLRWRKIGVVSETDTSLANALAVALAARR
jgi:cytochrome c biogenesis protein CcmG/thiol:disulfide interchange protein DsbE